MGQIEKNTGYFFGTPNNFEFSVLQNLWDKTKKEPQVMRLFFVLKNLYS